LKIESFRFGELEIDEEHLLLFPEGLVGLGAYKRFVLLEDPSSPDLLWLQSAERSEFALATVHASKLGNSYRVELPAEDAAIVQREDPAEVEVFVILNRHEGQFFANLKGPLFINARTRLGKQVVLSDPAFSVREPLETVRPTPTPESEPLAAQAS
jgi:flagellar assembly factor FliW